jgi:peptidoglycan/LPS O-acetylase OafA/YrhL
MQAVTKIDWKKNIPLYRKEQDRRNNLNFLRVALAVLVLYCHCFVLYYGTEDGVEPLWVMSHEQISLGSFAVNCFFAISGFLIYASWLKSENVGSFIRKRVFRIYPAFIVVCILCAFVFAPIGTIDWYKPYGYWELYFASFNFEEFFYNTIFLQEVNVPWTLKHLPIANAINGSLWTIKYEFFCYLLVAMFGLMKVYRYKWSVLILFVVSFSVYAWQYYMKADIYNWQKLPYLGYPDALPRFFSFFFAGAAIYEYKEFIPRKRWIAIVSLAIVVLGTFVFKHVVFTHPVFVTYLLFYFAFARSVQFHSFASKTDVSYGIYLYAWPVQQLLLLFFENVMNEMILFLCALPISYFLAYWSWHLIEKHFVKRVIFKFALPKVMPLFIFSKKTNA